MTKYTELHLFISHIEKLKEEIFLCKDPELKSIIQDEITFFNEIVNLLNKDR